MSLDVEVKWNKFAPQHTPVDCSKVPSIGWLGSLRAFPGKVLHLLADSKGVVGRKLDLIQIHPLIIAPAVNMTFQ